MKRFRRILHASDFSPASRPAFAQAIDMARCPVLTVRGRAA
jgi:nucleotide-binding universal stress UspA family protein